MKNRVFLYLLILLFIIGSSVFVFCLWRENTRTKLTAAEISMLSEIGELTLVGDYGFPPLSFTNVEGQYRGYEADLVSALELYLGIPIVYSQMIWEDALNALSSGEITAITGMRITEERAQVFNFTNHFWQTAYSFIYLLESNIDEVLASDSPTVVIQQQSATYDYFLEFYYHDGVRFIYVKQPSDAIEFLLSEEADLWFENYQVARYEMLKAGMLDLIRFNIVEDSIGNYAIALGPDHAPLVPIFNKALLHLEQERVLTELDRKWFGLADFRPEPSYWDFTLPILLYLLFSFLVITVFWNRSLQLRVEEKTSELSSSEKKYKASFESSHDAILITSKDGKILDCNRNAVQMFGFENKEELLSNNLEDIFPGKQPDGSTSMLLYKDKIIIVLETGALLRFDWTYRHNNGQLFQGEVSLTSFTLGDETLIQQNICDITERMQIQEKLEYLSLHDQLTGLYNRAYFQAELHKLSNRKYYPLTLISCDIDSLKLINDTFGHYTGDQQLIECAEIFKDSLRSEDVLARIGGDEFCVIMPNTDSESGEMILSRIRLNIERYNNNNPLVPMSVSVGMVTTESQVTEAEELIKKADELMYRNKVYSSASATSTVLNNLIKLLDHKDNRNLGHIGRMKEYCRQLGEAARLDDKQMADLDLLAEFHDLGKVSIPDKILNKAGKLNDREWEEIQQHSEKGYRIARSSPEIARIADLILKHHERWDGTGYPLGLAGEEIPIECRILNIVDSFDVMTNKRPYAEVRSRENALEEIKDNAGTRYDPTLVKDFISIFNENCNGNSS